jgi:RNA polymerase sigma-70 factor (ECF subfamily)
MISETTALAAGRFNQTHWSVVLLAAGQPSLPASAALEKLCETYWYPLYAFVRRRGYATHEAEDLIQEFFARLLAKDFLRTVDRSKGKFRSFLLAAMEHFLAKEWRRANAQKRGGNYAFVSIDDDTAEKPYHEVLASTLSPEQLFNQQWAIALLERVVSRLQEEFLAAGKQSQFDTLKIFLTGEKQAVRYAELAARLGKTEGALKMAVSRMIQRYGELLRIEIANTVSDPAEIEDELQELKKALS